MNLVEGNIFGVPVFVADPGSYNNSIVGNRIGIGVDGRRLGCHCSLAFDEPFNRAGGSNPVEANIYAGGTAMRLGASAAASSSRPATTSCSAATPGISGSRGSRATLTDNPVARLNRAVAVGEADGPRAGLAALAELDPTLDRCVAVAAYLHERDGDPVTASTAVRRRGPIGAEPP